MHIGGAIGPKAIGIADRNDRELLAQLLFDGFLGQGFGLFGMTGQMSGNSVSDVVAQCSAEFPGGAAIDHPNHGVAIGFVDLQQTHCMALEEGTGKPLLGEEGFEAIALARMEAGRIALELGHQTGSFEATTILVNQLP